jgi:hypothetical protein
MGDKPPENSKKHRRNDTNDTDDTDEPTNKKLPDENSIEFSRMLSNIRDDGSNAQKLISNFFNGIKQDPLIYIGIPLHENIYNIYNIDLVSTQIANFIKNYSRIPTLTDTIEPEIMVTSAHGVYKTVAPEHMYAIDVLKQKKKDDSTFDEETYKNNVEEYAFDIEMEKWLKSPDQINRQSTITPDEIDDIKGFIHEYINSFYPDYRKKFKTMYENLFEIEEPSSSQLSANIRLEDDTFDNSSIGERLILKIMEANKLSRDEASVIAERYDKIIAETTYVRQVGNICGVMLKGDDIGNDIDLTNIKNLSTRRQEQIVIHMVLNKIVVNRLPDTVVNLHLVTFFIRRVLRFMFNMDYTIINSKDPWEKNLKKLATTDTSWRSYRVDKEDTANKYRFIPNPDEDEKLYPNYGLLIINGINGIDDIINLMNKETYEEYDEALKNGTYGDPTDIRIRLIRIALYKLYTTRELDTVDCIIINDVINSGQMLRLFDSSCQHSVQTNQINTRAARKAGTQERDFKDVGFPEEDDTQRETEPYDGGKKQTRKKSNRKINSKRKKSKNTKRKTKRNKRDTKKTKKIIIGGGNCGSSTIEANCIDTMPTATAEKINSATRTSLKHSLIPVAKAVTPGVAGYNVPVYKQNKKK